MIETLPTPFFFIDILATDPPYPQSTAGIIAPVTYYYVKSIGSGSASTYGRRD